MKHGTDKVGRDERGFGHRYYPVYSLYLDPLRDYPITFFEIGFSTGNSAETWEEYLPLADVHEFEIACNETSPSYEGGKNFVMLSSRYNKWRFEKKRLHCGSVNDFAWMRHELDSIDYPDVVVDDGGHGPKEMILAFFFMFPQIKPGGLFFMEDIVESYVVGEAGFIDQVLRPLLDDLIRRDEHARKMPSRRKFPDITSLLQDISCHEGICVFRRNKQPSTRDIDPFAIAKIASINV
ncbi:hypothetical protein CYMTET_17048 [Cymbomonas tetramitiformis]|uniref:Class I SAM-dependent methyltransferase n=1 Tax=Cymbomonas tetramitiformis TaxID=36881 RepID=A0AAE0GBA5_9CHLO|nr:hypothetical protein CYMTET_17048 [Cymbomonas tetramitiformis]|eukprot:gene21887-26356_t